jgi:type II secretory pathway component PulM
MDKIKLAVGLFVIISIIYLGIQVIPAYYSNYEFQDAINQQAVQSTYTPQTADDIRDIVFRTAQQIGVPVTKDQIKVVRTGTEGSGAVSIDVPYAVPISIPGYPYSMQFDPSSKNHSTF